MSVAAAAATAVTTFQTTFRDTGNYDLLLQRHSSCVRRQCVSARQRQDCTMKAGLVTPDEGN